MKGRRALKVPGLPPGRAEVRRPIPNPDRWIKYTSADMGNGGVCLEERVATPFILSLLSGLFVLAGTVMGFVYLPDTTIYPYTYVPNYYVPFLVTSGICGILILFAAYMLYLKPGLHVAWGVMVLVLSVASVFSVVTGFYALFGAIGVIFGLLGGAMAIGLRAGGMFAPTMQNYMRMCPACGRYVPGSFPYCTYCGAPAPTVRPAVAGTGAPPSTPPGNPPMH
jgi:hypothetical protein